MLTSHGGFPHLQRNNPITSFTINLYFTVNTVAFPLKVTLTLIYKS